MCSNRRRAGSAGHERHLTHHGAAPECCQDLPTPLHFYFPFGHQVEGVTSGPLSDEGLTIFEAAIGAPHDKSNERSVVEIAEQG